MTDTPGFAGEWSEPVRVDAGSAVLLYPLFDAAGLHFIFEVDWGSSANDVSLVVYEEARDANGNYVCTIPGFELEMDPRPRCPVKVSQTGQQKPKRIEWRGVAGTGYSLFAENHGPEADDVRFRELMAE